MQFYCADTYGVTVIHSTGPDDATLLPHWNHHTEEEATWETKTYRQRIFPTFLEPIQVPNLLVLNLPIISGRDSFYWGRL